MIAGNTGITHQIIEVDFCLVRFVLLRVKYTSLGGEVVGPASRSDAVY
jgi:hypothetical protein